MTIASGTVISDKVFDEERALYRLKYATVKNCRFTGPTDGEDRVHIIGVNLKKLGHAPVNLVKY